MDRRQGDLTINDGIYLALATAATVAFANVTETPAYQHLVDRAAELVTGADEPAVTPEQN